MLFTFGGTTLSLPRMGGTYFDSAWEGCTRDWYWAPNGSIGSLSYKARLHYFLLVYFFIGYLLFLLYTCSSHLPSSVADTPAFSCLNRYSAVITRRVSAVLSTMPFLSLSSFECRENKKMTMKCSCSANSDQNSFKKIAPISLLTSKKPTSACSTNDLRTVSDGVYDTRWTDFQRPTPPQQETCRCRKGWC